ncbi:MAG: ABC transporter permease [Hyphomicrobiales bacterium]|nr:MAG: ABC transporter permease [Hyphomicrobiales bacterium]
MSAVAFWGAVEIGLIYAFVALGVYLTFRILDFPDLTVDGSFPLGAAVAAVLIINGVNPWLATLAAFFAGGCAGMVTAFLNVRFGILHLLASILTMIALFSVNLRVMGRPNIALLMQETVLTPFLKMGLHPTYARPLFLFVLVVIAFIGLMLFLRSNFGLAMRATGANQRMAGAQGIQTGFYVFTGVALSNGLVGIGGALFAQVNGFADVTTGVGTIVVGLASVIVGETLLRGRFIWIALIGCILGSIIYRIAVQLALSADVIGLKASDLNLATAVLVALALILPRLGKGKSA